MPLSQGCSQASLDSNIGTEISAGKDPRQAVAIAHSVLRRACRASGHPVPKKASTDEYVQSAMRLAKDSLPRWAFAVIASAISKSDTHRDRLRDVLSAVKFSREPSLLDLVPEERRAPIAEEIAVLSKASVLKSITAKECVAAMLDGEADVTVGRLVMEVVGKSIAGVELAFAGSDEAFTFSAAPELVLKVGDAVDVLGTEILALSTNGFPMTVFEAAEWAENVELVKAMTSVIEWEGPEENAPVVFVAASPNPLESARGGPIVGMDADVFTQRYLQPLGLKREDVVLGCIAPHWIPDPVDVSHLAPWLEDTKKVLRRHPNARIVALGKAAKEALGDIATIWVPHPAVIRKSGDTAHVDRKMKRIGLDVKKSLGDNKRNQPERAADEIAGKTESDHKERVVTLKAARPDAQIVYGVVLDPNMIDTQNDWAPPAEIQQTAHAYLEKSRVVGLEHSRKTQAKVVESFVEQYPSREDYLAAMDGRAHTVTRRKFGEDSLLSGAWVLGVKLEDAEWADYKNGDLTGFSIGGFSTRTPMDASALPKITVRDL